MGTHFRDLGVGVLGTLPHIFFSQGECVWVLPLPWLASHPFHFLSLHTSIGHKPSFSQRKYVWVSHLPWLIFSPLPFGLVMNPKFKSQL
jgi:hypothetical protein